MRNKSFQAYGMDIPEIVEILPTNLPAVEANEMRLDNLFRLKDGTIVIVYYESTYSYADKIKYLNSVCPKGFVPHTFTKDFGYDVFILVCNRIFHLTACLYLSFYLALILSVKML